MVGRLPYAVASVIIIESAGAEAFAGLLDRRLSESDDQVGFAVLAGLGTGRHTEQDVLMG
ncbi:MAG: hypothetical protein EA405_13725 [Rhodospirillales bacterium]|nr:MAG: hypothetical protein EA405_13725 [Rhodospirillales bacterium]